MPVRHNEDKLNADLAINVLKAEDIESIDEHTMIRTSRLLLFQAHFYGFLADVGLPHGYKICS